MAEEPKFIIDGDLRTIAVPDGYEIAGVESDKDVNRIRFEAPRYSDDIDLSEFSIRINYVNAAGVGDIYLVDDLESTADKITFSWLVGRNACAVAGELAFVVCMVKHDETGVKISKEFNTYICTLQVLDGIEPTESQIKDYYDAIENLAKKLDESTNSMLQSKFDDYDFEIASKLGEVPGLVENLVSDAIGEAGNREILDGSVSTAKIADNAVTPEKLSESYVKTSGDTMIGDLTIKREETNPRILLFRDESIYTDDTKSFGQIRVSGKEYVCGSINFTAYTENGKRKVATIISAGGNTAFKFIDNISDGHESEMVIPYPDVWLSALGVVDHIVDEGTSGNWDYIKYNSGYCICSFSKYYESTTALSSGNFYNFKDEQINLPFSITDIKCTANFSGVGYKYGSVINPSSEKITVRISDLAKAATLNSAGYVNVIAFGKWK